MRNEDEIPKPRKWEPGIAMRILRTVYGEKLQQMYWRRTEAGAFEHEWHDVPIVEEKPE